MKNLREEKTFQRKFLTTADACTQQFVFKIFLIFFFANRLDYFLFVRQNSDTFSLIDGSHVADIAVSMMMLLLVTIHSVTDCD